MSETVSPSAEVAAPAVYPVESLEAPNDGWMLALHPGHLALAPPGDPQPFVIVRGDVFKNAFLVGGLRILTLGKPVKRNFKLSADAVRAVAGWIGAPAFAAFHLKRRCGWTMPLGVVILVLSALAVLVPAEGASWHGDDVLGLAIGASLVAVGFLARWRPAPWLFAVDGCWFLALALQSVWRVADGRTSAGWLIWSAALVWFAISGFQLFRRFHGTRMTSGNAAGG